MALLLMKGGPKDKMHGSLHTAHTHLFTFSEAGTKGRKIICNKKVIQTPFQNGKAEALPRSTLEDDEEKCASLAPGHTNICPESQDLGTLGKQHGYSLVPTLIP
ncbi:hypothetical protein STEG23_017631 [Scotinomys teguina]